MKSIRILSEIAEDSPITKIKLEGFLLTVSECINIYKKGKLHLVTNVVKSTKVS